MIRDYYGLTAVIEFEDDTRAEIPFENNDPFTSFKNTTIKLFENKKHTEPEDNPDKIEYKLKYWDESYELRDMFNEKDLKEAIGCSPAQYIYFRALKKIFNPFERDVAPWMCQVCSTKNEATDKTCSLCGTLAPFKPN